MIFSYRKKKKESFQRIIDLYKYFEKKKTQKFWLKLKYKISIFKYILYIKLSKNKTIKWFFLIGINILIINIYIFFYKKKQKSLKNKQDFREIEEIKKLTGSKLIKKEDEFFEQTNPIEIIRQKLEEIEQLTEKESELIKKNSELIKKKVKFFEDEILEQKNQMKIIRQELEEIKIQNREGIDFIKKNINNLFLILENLNSSKKNSKENSELVHIKIFEDYKKNIKFK